VVGSLGVRVGEASEEKECHSVTLVPVHVCSLTATSSTLTQPSAKGQCIYSMLILYVNHIPVGIVTELL